MCKYIFTIATLCYNCSKTIERVYNTLKSQTFPHNKFEWLIIDDCSSDNSEEVIKKFIKEADFKIRYIKNENNQMIPKNIRKAIELAQGEYFYGIGHDDANTADLLEIVNNIFEKYQECCSVNFLCKDQFGNNLGKNFPKEGCLKHKEAFKWDYNKIGEIRGIWKSNLLKKYYIIPKIIDRLRYIPESYFWRKIGFELFDEKSFFLNKRLVVYYIEENSVSKDIREKYSEGFRFESLYFINNYIKKQLLYNPKIYLKYLIKYIIHSKNKNFLEMLAEINNNLSRIMLILFYIPAIFLRRSYFNNKLR